MLFDPLPLLFDPLPLSLPPLLLLLSHSPALPVLIPAFRQIAQARAEERALIEAWSACGKRETMLTSLEVNFAAFIAASFFASTAKRLFFRCTMKASLISSTNI